MTDPWQGSARATALRAQVYTEETHCWLCGEWVDQTLPPTSGRSRTVDHVIERWQGGDPFDRNNCRLAHMDCNTRKSMQRRHPQAPRPQLTTDIGGL